MFGHKVEDDIVIITIITHEGVANYPAGIAVDVMFDDANGQLAILRKHGNSTPIYLKYSQISAVRYESEKEFTSKNKSVIGRAAVGGLVLGPLGAVVGGISGTGSKQKTTTTSLIVIDYISSNSEPKTLSFKISWVSSGWDNFVKTLKNRIPETTPKSQYL